MCGVVTVMVIMMLVVDTEGAEVLVEVMVVMVMKMAVVVFSGSDRGGDGGGHW